ncbi:unnamed protein product [Meganyctiphanes norvegica]|uniref:Uncharacterized protein n=1 Tax=Meganyctiphanes norvegica TaxID=48144 RepID=A0AAV2QZI9_MEGNR
MADGTPSKSVRGWSEIIITRADKPDKTGLFSVVIVDGPHVLLGRPALQALWPEEYNSLAEVAKQSIKAICKSCCVCAKGAATTPVTDAATDAATPHTQRSIPSFPSGDVTQEEGEALCLKVCDVYPELFDGKLGLFKGVEANLHLKPGYEKHLRVMPPAKVPYGLEDEVNVELEKMKDTWVSVDGIGLKVASQLVSVVKNKNDKNKRSVRLCGNYKRTINDLLEDEPYQFPTCNEQLEKLKGEYYSCVDVKGAYTQVAVPPPSRSILTVATPRGYMEPTRMPFGVKTAPKYFKKVWIN